MKVKLSNPIKNMYGDPLHIGDGIIEVDVNDNAINMLIRDGAIDPVYEEVKKEASAPIMAEVVKSTTIEIKKVYTKEELKKLNKAKHTEILKDYGFIKIPLLEKDRIELILNMQKKG